MTFPSTLRKLRSAYTNRYEPESIHVLADMYWRALLLVLALVITAELLYGLFQFVSVIGGSSQISDSPSVQVGEPALNRGELEATVNGFEERRRRYEFLKSNPPQITDPSR